MKPRHSLRVLCGTIIGIVPQSCVMNASVSFILSSFSKWGQLCFCQHSWFNGTPSDEKTPAASSLFAGGKVAHFENDTASENYSPRMVFNQECRWNNGSKSLHSFWATLYRLIYGLWGTHVRFSIVANVHLILNNNLKCSFSLRSFLDSDFKVVKVSSHCRIFDHSQ